MQNPLPCSTTCLADLQTQVLGDFTLYDYKKPLDVRSELQGSFNVVVADPPYLSAECLDKAVQTMRCLGCSGGSGPADFFLLTGASMRLQAFHLLRLRCHALSYSCRSLAHAGFVTPCLV